MKKNLELIAILILCITIITLVLTYVYGKINILVTLIVFAITVGISFLIYLKKDITEEKIFLYIMPIILIMLVFSIPIVKNADEIVHWHKVYDISQGNIITKKSNGIGMGWVPESVRIIIPQNEINYEKVAEIYEREVNENEEKVGVDLATDAIYHPLTHAPQVLGILVAKIFTNKPVIMMYMARIFNAICSFVLLYLAIKIIPYGKRIMLLLTCIPVCANSLASMSTDALTISVAYLLIAYVLKLINEKQKKIELKEKIILRSFVCYNLIMQNRIFTISGTYIAFTKRKI